MTKIKQVDISDCFYSTTKVNDVSDSNILIFQLVAPKEKTLIV
jgi:hypothetical protein